MSNLGIVALDQGRYAEAERLFRESRELSTSAGNTWSVASTTNNLGEALRLQHRLEEACACFADSAAKRSRWNRQSRWRCAMMIKALLSSYSKMDKN